MAKPQSANPLFGAADEDTKRFDIAQDPRRMYPVSAFGKLYGYEMVPNRLQTGSSGYFGKQVTNMIPVGDGTTLSSIGNPEQISAVKKAIRLGVTGTTGGDFTGTADYSFVFANRLLAFVPINLYVMMSSGEAVYRDTDASANQYGAISEAFTVGAVTATWVSGAGGTTAITTSAALSTLALATAYTYTPSLQRPTIGDIIRLNYDDGTSFTYHRITAISGVNVTIAPATLPNKNGTAKTFQLLRTGLRSMSRIVTITDLANGRFYNYYAGNASDLVTAPHGTIQCWTQNTSGGFLNHYMCPQTVDDAVPPVTTGFDVIAKDIIYYKNYLLYGYGQSISWSVAGFPTSFTTGFGAADFPALNTTVVANDDEFMSFEMLGDNVIALFKNSIWQVRASGTIPEFNFSRLIEPVGCFGGYNERPSTSARGRIYYKTTDGIAELSGQIATKISDPIRSLTTQATLGNLSWEPTTDTLMVNTSSNDDHGFMYNVTSQTWAFFDLTTVGTAAISARCVTGNVGTIRSCMQASFYERLSNTIYFLDGRNGGPASPENVADTAKWTWSSPVISMGDAHDGFKLGGFQAEGDAEIDWEIYGGPTPVGMTLRDSGTGATSGNRILLGKKIEDPFIFLVLNSKLLSSGKYRPGKIYGVNIYDRMGGK